MADRDHLRIAIATTAPPEDVFARLRHLANAALELQPEAVQAIGQPSLSARPPVFTLRSAGTYAKGVAVGWTGRVQANGEGSLIVAEARRPRAIWIAFPLFVLLAGVLLEWGQPVREGNPVIGFSVMAAFVAIIMWVRTGALSDTERREVLALFEVMLSILPNARQVPVPESPRSEKGARDDVAVQ